MEEVSSARNKPRYRRPLNLEQIEILELLYKFRFVSRASLIEYYCKSKPGMDVYRRLRTLEDRGFIAKRYLPDYQLFHKPVVYYLLPVGARELVKYRDENDRQIIVKSMYRSGSVGEPFIMHSFAIFGLYNQLTDLYGDDIDFLSKSDLAGSEFYQNADAYVIYKGTHEFFIDILDDDAHLQVDTFKKIKRYIDYRLSSDWVTTYRSFPKVVFVCNSKGAAKKVQERCNAILNKVWMHDVEVVTVTSNRIELG